MPKLLVATVTIFLFSASFSQSSKLKSKKYPSLLWEITGKGHAKPSYLFGTMHVSSKMVFHLSDSFYLSIKNADIVALETNPGNWQDDFSRYDLDGNYYGHVFPNQGAGLNDYLSINTLKAYPYEKLLERALYSSPSIINSFLYRNNSEESSDFEEDTYLDLYIYQVGRKWNKKVCGVEDFDKSMALMKEAYADAAKDKNSRERGYGDNDFSYAKMEEAYRSGNLDLLDTINKANSTSPAFTEKFLYRRNEIQASAIDSIIKTGASLFVGVGAAHLPGDRGVIELLRRNGYKLRPIKMTERDSRHKEMIETIRVPVAFKQQTAEDGFFSVSLPGKLYSFTKSFGSIVQRQYADMSNGSYYMVTRIRTNAALWGQSPETVQHKIDSVLYDNIPGKIISKQPITKNGYKGFDILNRTRRGDYQRYNIFVAPYEVILFKMSGNGEYVKAGREATLFFNSIQLKEYKSEWKKYSPIFGGFEAEMPHQPLVSNNGNWQFAAYDKATATNFEVIRTDVHNMKFVEEDSFDLNLLEESFATSDFIEKQVSRRQTVQNRYAALDAKYKCKDGSVALVKFVIQGPHYYTLVANAAKENARMQQFLHSFTIKPFIYKQAQQQADSLLHYEVLSPVAIEKPKKLEMYPEDMYGDNEEALLEDGGMYKNKIVENDSTGEKIYVLWYKPSRYYFDKDAMLLSDSSHFKTNEQDWIFRHKRKYVLPDKTKVTEYELGDDKSSRVLRGKLFEKEGTSYNIVAMGDTLTQWSSFVNDFFSSFSPSNTVKDITGSKKKTAVFFADFFSTDTLMHKRAVKNIQLLKFDSSDFYQLKNAIESLSWKERKYLDVKNAFISKLSAVRTKEATDFLKYMYYAAGDTLDMQYRALETLLKQRTVYAYQVFRDIMLNEPPVLGVNGGYPNTHDFTISFNWAADTIAYADNYGATNSNGYFMDDLKDSLALTKTIFNDLLPLININDYEQPMTNLLETLIDSNLITGKEYELYLPKFLIEARQELKKQLISEKNKAIDHAQQDDDERNKNYNPDNKDAGNSRLSSYATLLIPFWETNALVPQWFQQLLACNDKRLKYNTAMLLLRHQNHIPDTLLHYLAAQDEFRYELYVELRKNNMLHFFPAAYNNHIDLAKSQLMQLRSYNAPDTLVYIDKLPLQYRSRNGWIYFFKYRQKRDARWKIATVGLIPDNEKAYEFENKGSAKQEYEYNFTEMTDAKLDAEEPLKAQLQNVLKRELYSKRKSGLQFYDGENKYGLLNSFFSFRD